MGRVLVVTCILAQCFHVAGCLPLSAEPSGPVQSVTLTDLQQQLAALALDPNGAYHVRDLRLRRGDVTLLFNEGTLMLTKPVAGRTIAAVFTTADTEAGDGEVLLLSQQQASERMSLASFTGGPNLDEHFQAAILYFADNTVDELREELARSGAEAVPDIAAKAAEQVNSVLKRQTDEVRVAMLSALLDAHKPDKGPFFATILGRRLGAFEMFYYPDSFEPTTIGRTDTDKAGQSEFRIWTGYRPRGAPPYVQPPSAIRDYRLEVTIGNDLGMQTTARFRYAARPENGRAIGLSLSPRLKVESATIDGIAAEVAQSLPDVESGPFERDASILLTVPEPLRAGKTYDVEIRYGGSIIRRVSNDSYFVGDRAIWYPRSVPILTEFDLVFHFPERFRLVATGETVEPDQLSGHMRTVHRRTTVAEQLAGFNLGEYSQMDVEAGPYHVDCYADKLASMGMNGIPAESAKILREYTARWMPLPIRSLSITPIPGYFGQGFPGLIYLSNMAYVREENRPAQLRNQVSDMFFSNLLLPHEIAHQWWGNIVASSDYRSSWIMEAMANYSAVEFAEQRDGLNTAARLLTGFRDELLQIDQGKTIDSFGPLDFGDRLLDNNGEKVWHDIVYQKGAWVLHMLRERLGAENFRSMQLYILEHERGRSISNDDFREAAQRFLPADDPDKTLKKFFETWVYGTGIPKLRLINSGTRNSKEQLVLVSGVDDEFTADLPLRCKGSDGIERRHWLPIVSGENIAGRSGGWGTCALPGATEYLMQP